MPSDARRAANDRWDRDNTMVVSAKLRREQGERFRVLAYRNNTTPHALIKGWVKDYIAQHEQDTGEK